MNHRAAAHARTGPALVCLTLLVACALPWSLSDYRLFQLTQVFILAIALLGLNLLTGWCGQISLGHGAFFALGAYCSALLMQRFGLSDWMSLPVCALVCFVSGWLFGWPAARLQGLYLALASFALAVALPQLLKHRALEPLTGGTGGLVLDAAYAPVWWPTSVGHWHYALSLAVLLVMILLTARLVRGRYGRAMLAVRDQPIAASALGIDRATTKIAAFALSAMYAGIAGGLSAASVRYVGPDSFDMFLSISFVVGIVIGGLASIAGSLLGAVFIQFVPHVAEHISREASWAIYGGFLLLALWLIPGGLAGLINRVIGRATYRG